MEDDMTMGFPQEVFPTDVKYLWRFLWKTMANVASSVGNLDARSKIRKSKAFWL